MRLYVVEREKVITYVFDAVFATPSRLAGADGVWVISINSIGPSHCSECHEPTQFGRWRDLIRCHISRINPIC